MIQPFSYVGATTTAVPAPASASAAMNAGVGFVMLYNAGPNLAFVRWGVGAQTAVITDMPMPVGTVQIFSKGVSDTLAAVCASGSATIYVTSGEGQ